jgi:prepilin-type N-terminal cleavage/methylation domain-containing protein
MKRLHFSKAFTLIELLVSISIVGILSILIVQSFFTSLRNNTKTELMKDLKQNGDFAMQVMVRMIQNAQSIPVCNTNSLTLRSFDGQETTFHSNITEGVCGIASSSALPLPSGTDYTLTSSNVTMTGVCSDAIKFSCEPIQNQTAKVNISFGLTQKGSPPDAIDIAKQDFSSSVVVRNRQL